MLSEGQFVNWNCGQGMSIACDMAQDICHMVRCGGKRDYKSKAIKHAMVRALWVASSKSCR